MNLKEWQERKTQLLEEAKAMAETAATENREFTPEERNDVKAKLDEVGVLKGKIESAKADQAVRDQLTSQLGDLDLNGNGHNGNGTDRADGVMPPGKGRTIGEQFVNSDEYKSFLGQFPNGRIPEKARVQSLPVGFKTLITGTDDTSAGAFVRPEWTGIIDLLGRVSLTMRSLVSVRQTSSDTVEYVQQTGRTNAAAVVAEATQTSGTSGLKPEGGFTFQKVTSPVRTIAEWIPATRRALADVGQLRSLIDQELRADLRDAEEREMLTGDGTGEHLLGLLNTPGLQTQAAGGDVFETTRKARTKVRLGGFTTPTAYLLNPMDWEAIDLMRDGVDRFYGAGPFAMTTPTLWGLPVVESEYMPQGTGVVGDFRRAVLWDREQATISVSDSHENFFVRNLIAVLAEQRVAFGVVRPAAFVKMDLTAAEPPP